tara:strand:+ start:100 stop:423 length:324 start_codon:yes stop_codon:yes gene_type:complete
VLNIHRAKHVQETVLMEIPVQRVSFLETHVKHHHQWDRAVTLMQVLVITLAQIQCHLKIVLQKTTAKVDHLVGRHVTKEPEKKHVSLLLVLVVSVEVVSKQINKPAI